MRILVACEFSGVVRDAFIAKGHDAVSCDILPTERPGPHIQDDVLLHLEDGWDMMIAHPPCIYLSNAGARHLYPKGVLNELRLKKGLEAKDFFMQLYNTNINKICIENPMPSKVFGLPKESQVIQPFEYGHPFRKRTYLWLKGLSDLIQTHKILQVENTKVPGNWFNKGGKDRQQNRARTFQGIANAMAEQWG